MPLSNEQLEELRKPMKTLKIVCGALLAGVCMTAIIVCVLVDFANLNTNLVMLVALAATTGAVMYSTSFIAFKVISAQTHSRKDELKSHFGVLQSAWIVRFALVEGACFLNLIVTLLENSLITLFVAVLGILILLLAFPSTMKVEELIEARVKS
jgi:MFS family permease